MVNLIVSTEGCRFGRDKVSAVYRELIGGEFSDLRRSAESVAYSLDEVRLYDIRGAPTLRELAALREFGQVYLEFTN